VYGDKDFIEGGGYMTAHSQIDAFTYLVAKVYSLNQLRVEQTGAVGDGARALINVVFYHLLTNIIELWLPQQRKEKLLNFPWGRYVK